MAPHMSTADGPSMEDKPGYSDIEVQNFSGQLRLGPGDSGEQIEVSRSTSPTENGLDNNEVAELIGFHRVINVYHNPNGNQTAASTAVVEFGMGADLGSSGNFDPFLPNLGGDGTNWEADTSDPNISPTTNNLYQDDDAAQLDFTQLTLHLGYSSGGGGFGGSGSGAFGSREVDYRSMYSHGPVFDRTDDLSIGAEVDADENTADQVLVQPMIQLRWRVYEVDGYRAEFDFPN